MCNTCIWHNVSSVLIYNYSEFGSTATHIFTVCLCRSTVHYPNSETWEALKTKKFWPMPLKMQVWGVSCVLAHLWVTHASTARWFFFIFLLCNFLFNWNVKMSELRTRLRIRMRRRKASSYLKSKNSELWNTHGPKCFGWWIVEHITPSDWIQYFFTLNSSSLTTPLSLRSLQELSAERVTSQRLRAELVESRSHLEAKKQDVEKLRRLMEEMQTRVSELTMGQSSREQQQAKEVDRLQAMLAHMEREIQSIRYVSVCYVALLSTESCHLKL